MVLRIAGTPPLIAQAPTEIRMRQFFSKFSEFLDVVLIRAASFDETDIDRPIERFLVIEWRHVEIDKVD